MAATTGSELDRDTAIRLLLRSTVVEPVKNCWLWQRTKIWGGYGQTQWHGRLQLVHRVMYEHYFGPIPAGKDLDHLCRVRACCNPFHVEPVTRRENMLRSPHTIRPTCPHGHELSGYNLVEKLNRHGGVTRYCRECGRIAQRQCRARRLARL